MVPGMIHGEIIDIQNLEYLEVKQLVSIGFHWLFNHDMVIFSVEAIVIVDSVHPVHPPLQVTSFFKSSSQCPFWKGQLLVYFSLNVV